MAYTVAFAASGEYIDRHFGSARYFQIYRVEGEAHTFIETRRVAAKCKGNCEGGFDHLLKALNDCDAVFVLKIGPSAAAFMIQHGKRVFEATGAILEIIAEIARQNLLNEVG